MRHQYVNLVHVIHAELQLIERMSGKLNAFRESIHLCEAAIRAFGERNTALGFRDDLIEFRSRIVSPVAAFEAPDADDLDIADIDDARNVLMSLIDAADVRVQEILARHGIDRPWQAFDFATIAGVGDPAPESPSATDRAVGGALLQAPAGFAPALARLVRCVGDKTPARLRVDASGRSTTVSVITPGAALPGSEFTTCEPVDYELLRSDPDQASKLALLGAYFVVLPSGCVEFTSSESHNDTLLLTVRPVA